MKERYENLFLTWNKYDSKLTKLYSMILKKPILTNNDTYHYHYSINATIYVWE